LVPPVVLKIITKKLKSASNILVRWSTQQPGYLCTVAIRM
jgi:diketogulonate reductase-like aldo/keto reductase